MKCECEVDANDQVTSACLVHAEYGRQIFAGQRVPMPDGLYRYVWGSIVVGFVVKDGRLTDCAPWLRAKLAHPRYRDEWRYRMTTATRIAP